MKLINPATEEVISEYNLHTARQVQEVLLGAGEQFHDWRQTSFEHRAQRMKRAGAVLRERLGEYAALITREMGKPIAQSEAEIDKCAAACDFFADRAAGYLEPEERSSDADRSYVRFDPLGAVLAIMPWNFPFWQVFRFAAPSLMAGNVGILKHALNVSGCAIAIEQIFRDAGFPTGVFTTLLIEPAEVPAIINHPAVRAVTLTGSGRAGSAVASQAGHAIKKTVLELGGSDPFIVLPDANTAQTADAAVSARTINTGQSCIAAKRFIVVGDADGFAKLMADRVAKLKVGDPTCRDNHLGPLARKDLLEHLQDQVRRSIEGGARVLAGNQALPKKGFFFAPVVLAGVRPGMAAFDEEVFGPVAAVISARDADEAVDLANQSRYGLGSSIWTNDIVAGERLAARIDSGCVFINGTVKSDPRLPFGGTKESGYGRELAREGIREFVNVKTVWVKRQSAAAPGVQSE